MAEDKPKMFHYLVIGRVIGDHEDTLLTYCDTCVAEVKLRFVAEMILRAGHEGLEVTADSIVIVATARSESPMRLQIYQ